MKVSVDVKGYPKGMPVSVGGLPLVDNGGSIDLSDEQVSDFVAHHGQTPDEFFKDNDEVKVAGTSGTKKGGD